jgi:hypothetical protein
MDALRLPISPGKLLLIAIGLVVLLLALGNLVSWSIAVLAVCFGALAVPYMIVIMKGEHG